MQVRQGGVVEYNSRDKLNDTEADLATGACPCHAIARPARPTRPLTGSDIAVEIHPVVHHKMTLRCRATPQKTPVEAGLLGAHN